MRTTINLDDALIAEAKQVAARTGRSLTAVVEDALRQSLYRRDPTPRQAIELPVFGEGGTQPGVDLDDSAALLDLMEQDDPVADDATR
jgi:plasmid stability protein